MKKFILLIATATGLSLAYIGAQPALAETGQALEIAPPVVNLKADPGQTITTKISLRGVSTETLVVNGQVNNFTAAGEDGTPKLLLDSEEDAAYSLKGWVSPLPRLTLKPKQVEDMTVTIKVPANAAPGGYYGVIRFTATPPELEGTGVSLSASLGSLIFLRVSGESKESLEVAEFAATNSQGEPSTLFEGTPIQFMERFKNTGNTHLQPAGQVTITDMFGQKVATLNVNLPPRNILPDSIRKFDQPLDKAVIGDKMLFGQYTATLNITYGDSHKTVSSSITFWVIPYRLIGLVVIGLVGGFFLLRFLIGRYNRSIIRKSQGGGLRIGSKRK